VSLPLFCNETIKIIVEYERLKLGVLLPGIPYYLMLAYQRRKNQLSIKILKHIRDHSTNDCLSLHDLITPLELQPIRTILTRIPLQSRD